MFKHARPDKITFRKAKHNHREDNYDGNKAETPKRKFIQKRNTLRSVHKGG
jgi:hypothetical protein